MNPYAHTRSFLLPTGLLVVMLAAVESKLTELRAQAAATMTETIAVERQARIERSLVARYAAARASDPSNRPAPNTDAALLLAAANRARARGLTMIALRSRPDLSRVAGSAAEPEHFSIVLAGSYAQSVRWLADLAEGPLSVRGDRITIERSTQPGAHSGSVRAQFDVTVLAPELPEEKTRVDSR